MNFERVVSNLLYSANVGRKTNVYLKSVEKSIQIILIGGREIIFNNVKVSQMGPSMLVTSVTVFAISSRVMHWCGAAAKERLLLKGKRPM